MSPNSLSFRALEFYGTKIPHRGKWWVHGQLRKLLHANCDAELQITRGGLNWVLNPSDYAQAEFFWLADHEHWERYHFERLLRPGDVIFDIGANFGYYSITACGVLKGNCIVHAFEPNPALHSRLVKNVDLNGFASRIRSHPVAMSDTPGLAHMAVKPGHSGLARVIDTGSGVPVALTTLDEFCDVNAVNKIDMVKMDVEGLEERVLRGGRRTITCFKPSLLVELHPSATNARGSIRDTVRLLQEYGYHIYTAHRRKLVPLVQLPVAGNPVKVFGLRRDRAG